VKKKRKEKEALCTYQDTVVVKRLAWDELIAVIVLVRWEQFTNKLSVDVRECSQVEGKHGGVSNQANAQMLLRSTRSPPMLVMFKYENSSALNLP